MSKIEGIVAKRPALQKNGKRSSTERMKMKQVRNLNLHIERKNIRERISESEVKTYFSYSLLI